MDKLPFYQWWLLSIYIISYNLTEFSQEDVQVLTYGSSLKNDFSVKYTLGVKIINPVKGKARREYS